MRASAKQTDGRKPLPHIITAIVSVVASLAAAHYLHLGAAGAQGPAGPAGSSMPSVTITKSEPGWVCTYYGPDQSGTVRYQVTQASADKNGPYCAKGTLVSTVPRK